MTPVGGVRALAALLAWLAAWRRLAMVVAAAGGAVTVAALAAHAGAFAAVRWLALVWWVAALTGLTALAWTSRGWLRRPGPAAWRGAAARAEAELGLRRGALVGVLDLAERTVEGQSPVLAAAHARSVMAVLPTAGATAWAPGAVGAARRAARRWSVAGVAALAAAGAAVHAAGAAAAPVLSPLAALRSASGSALRLVLTPEAVAAGGTAAAVVSAEAGRATASLYVRSTGEEWRRLAVPLDPAGRGRVRLEALRATTWAYAEAGDAVSETLAVQVRQPLAVGALVVRAAYPAYLDRAPEELDPAAGPLVVPAGTRLEVRVTASAALARAQLAAGPDTVRLAIARVDAAGVVAVRHDAVWRFDLVARDGAVLGEPLTLDVRAIADSAPRVAVTVPGADTVAPLDLRPVLVVEARDDHALDAIEVLSWRVSRLGLVGDTVVAAVPGAAGADRVALAVTLDLTARGLLPGDTLRYVVRARDRAPVPRVGWSRTYALRLRSMAELREAVRSGGDSLARAAAAVAGDQTALTRRTEDLAAQRARPAEPAGARPSAATERAQVQATEQRAEAERVLAEQEQLVARAESLRAAVERLAAAAEEAGVQDPEFQRQLQELERLLEQALTPELRQRLEELRRALQNVDARQLQEALRRLADDQQRLRDELTRGAELFERAALEGSLQTAAADAEALQRQQEAWNRQAALRRDSATAATEQAALRSGADSLAAVLSRLEERLGSRGESTAARATGEAGRDVQRAAGRMASASQEMQGGARAAAARAGAAAADALQDVPERLRRTQEALADAWRQDVLQRLQQATTETVTLAREQQQLAQQLRQGMAGQGQARGRQSAAEQGIAQVMRNLQEAAGRHALVSPRLGGALAQSRQLVQQSRQALEGPTPDHDEAARLAQAAAQSLSASALQMLQAGREVGGAQSGSGLAEALERMGQLAGQQGQLNDQLAGLLPMLGAGDELVRQQLRLLAEQQRRIADRLERLGASGLPGRPDQLADESRALADRLEQGRLDRATLERQQRLFRRMLDAGRSLRNEDQPEDPERRSRTASAAPVGAAPGRLPGEAALRYPLPPWEALRALTPADRALVLDYFRRLNASDR